MAEFEISGSEALYYEYVAPVSKANTFVFVNALTGNTTMWTNTICGHLHDAGYGTLVYNFRGQLNTRFGDETDLNPRLIVEDLCSLMQGIAPPAPILVGLSIGGLFAAQACLAGAPASGMVLINTLRKPTQRLDWINQAMVRMARLGGGRLVMMANMPVIATPDLLANMWETSFDPAPFEAPAKTDGLLRLMIGALETDWDFPYEELKLPTLLMTGKHDRLFRIDADIAELKARLSDVQEKIYPHAGHLIPLEAPDEFSTDLLEFASRC